MRAYAFIFSVLVLCGGVFPAGGASSVRASDHDLRTTDACFIVYKSLGAAAARCPAGAEPSKVNDFWTGQLRGYSCRCRGPGFLEEPLN